MKEIIKFTNVTKEYKVLNHRQGVLGGVKDLFSRNYNIIKAVNDINFSIEKGEIVGYLGPNGAGKSTTIKMMTGVLEPTCGEILVDGLVPHKKRAENAQNIGVVFGQRTQLWWALPAIESFRILKDIYMVNDKDYKDMLELYSSLVDLDILLKKAVRQMSLGQRTLTDILAAFLHNPSIVFLDEPTIGLDVSMKSKIRELVRLLNKEKNTTVILTTHDMSDVDALCQRVVIIDKGKKIYDDDINKLKGLYGNCRNLKVHIENKVEQQSEDVLKQNLEQVKDILLRAFHKTFTVVRNNEWIDILVNEDEISIIGVLNEIQQHWKLYDIKIQEISTEDVIKKVYEGV
ncbi:ABC transporter ATP-binding protein [[Clostridium] polysaccharolyticum]|uniref:ABC-2 type transport system ATP-binding protein n=1 Tax=[Clostridium] polysaccharolyticum TaxID=29364 RepID=A0A1I0G157_9FIRM|nr:ATP-binding cassette domain-containing protein [[Clostridium] polysaccharolyticum]SET64555.1 ABC-2 type transport system ATP-binding protein [[Clostridium] polysaccharolyticum]